MGEHATGKRMTGVSRIYSGVADFAARRPFHAAVLAAGLAASVALLWFDPEMLAVVLAALAAVFALHSIATWLAEVRLLVPCLVALTCIGIFLWWTAPETFDLGAEIGSRTPAPVKRLVAPVERLLSPGSRPVEGTDGNVRVSNALQPPGVRNPADSASRTEPVSPLALVKSPVRVDPRGPSSTAVAAGSARHKSAGRRATTTTLTLGGSTSVLGDTVLFVANVRAGAKGPDVPTGVVELWDGGSRVATAKVAARSGESVAVFKLSLSAVGPHAVTAVYRGNRTFASSRSTLVLHTVKPDPN